jgi:hypothetical protein
VRIAIVGLGKMGLLHASILSTLSDVELVGLGDKSRLIRRFAGKCLEEPSCALARALRDWSFKKRFFQSLSLSMLSFEFCF